MAVVGDPSRVSTLRVEKPYMGLGEQWPVPTTSWAELNYTNMCVNSCWELYGAVDRYASPPSSSGVRSKAASRDPPPPQQTHVGVTSVCLVDTILTAACGCCAAIVRAVPTYRAAVAGTTSRSSSRQLTRSNGCRNGMKMKGRIDRALRTPLVNTTTTQCNTSSGISQYHPRGSSSLR